MFIGTREFCLLICLHTIMDWQESCNWKFLACSSGADYFQWQKTREGNWQNLSRILQLKIVCHLWQSKFYEMEIFITRVHEALKGHLIENEFIKSRNKCVQQRQCRLSQIFPNQTNLEGSKFYFESFLCYLTKPKLYIMATILFSCFCFFIHRPLILKVFDWLFMSSAILTCLS